MDIGVSFVDMDMFLGVSFVDMDVFLGVSFELGARVYSQCLFFFEL
jgi:hypothetical protein